MTDARDNRHAARRCVLGLAGVLAALLLSGTAVGQETARTIPAPTAAQLEAGPGPAAEAIDPKDARLAMGWPPFLAGRTIQGIGKTRVAIVDSGFRGLDSWLSAHPDEAARTTVVDTGPVTGTESEHGFKVYRVMRTVAADAQLVLYRVTKWRGIYTALADAARRKVVIANVSLGLNGEIDIREPADPDWDHFDALLRQTEMFVFFAAANEREETHTFLSADRDGNGHVDFFRAPPPQTGRADEIALGLKAGVNKVYVAWDPRVEGASYALELTDLAGNVLAADSETEAWRPGYLRVEHRAAAVGKALVRLRRLGGLAEGVLMRIAVDAGFSVPPLNGLQSVPTHIARDNPFLVIVGGFGRTAAGTIAPSVFSNAGYGADGALYPHVLGPGQLILDGQKISGTSYASPFLTAIYAFAQGYNIKNIIARSASFARLDPAVPPWQRSRWGVPEQFKAFGATALRSYKVVGPTKVDAVTHAVAGDALTLRFTVTRCCMEGMTWTAGVWLADPVTGAYLAHPETKKALDAWQSVRSTTADETETRFEVTIPLAGAGIAPGREVAVRFQLAVRSWAEAQGTIKPDEAPDYRVKF